MKKLIIIAAISVAYGCGMKVEEVKTATLPSTVESIQPATNPDVCLKDGSGKPIVGSSGVCWNAEPAPIVESSPMEISEDILAEITDPPEAPTNKVVKRKYRPKPTPPKPKVVKSIPKKEIIPPVALEPVKVFPEVKKAPSDLELLDIISRANITLDMPTNAKVNEKLTAALIVTIPDKQENISAILTAKIFTPSIRTTPHNSEKQILTQLIPAKWTWELVPRKSGKLEIVVSVSAKVNQTERFLATYNKIITVENEYSFIEKIYSYWPIIMMLVVVIWLIKRFFFTKPKEEFLVS